MPASSIALSSSLPAGPTKGFPALSSWSPGCSPTNMASAFAAPSPKTVWVPVFQSGQALQPAAAVRSFLRLGLSGTSGAAVSSSRLCCAIASFGYPEGADTIRFFGAVAERLGRGLQSPVQRFDSARRLVTLDVLTRVSGRSRSPSDDVLQPQPIPRSDRQLRRRFCDALASWGRGHGRLGSLLHRVSARLDPAGGDT